jgi:hypothetical protein
MAPVAPAMKILMTAPVVSLPSRRASGAARDSHMRIGTRVKKRLATPAGRRARSDPGPLSPLRATMLAVPPGSIVQSMRIAGPEGSAAVAGPTM